MKKLKVYFLALLLLSVLLTSCVKTPNSTNTDGVVVADPNSKIDSQEPKEETDSKYTLNEQNTNIIISSASKKLNEVFELSNGKKIVIDAVVDVEGITNVGSYSYVLKPIADELRNTLFSAFFGDRASSAKYDELNNKWTIANSKAVGDYYLYETFNPKAGPTISGEESFSLEYRNVNLYPFADNLLPSVNDSTVKTPLKDVISMCDQIMNEITDVSTYKVDYIFAYGTNGRRPYYKVVYKRMLDNTILTGFNDIYFLVDNNGIQKISGSFFNIVELQMEKQILSVDEAMSRLKNNSIQISFDEDLITIGKVTFEYVVVNTIEGEAKPTPVWRFLIGSSDEEMSLNRDKIIAIDAITGDIICDERGNTF